MPEEAVLAAERREQWAEATALLGVRVAVVQRSLSAALRDPEVAAAVAWRQPRMLMSADRC